MHSLMHFTGCPVGNPVPSLSTCRITHAVAPKDLGAGTDVTHLVTPHVRVRVALTKHQRLRTPFLSHFSGHRAGSGSFPPLALALHLTYSYRGLPAAHLGARTSTHPPSSLQSTSGKGMEPVEGKKNKHTIYTHP